MAPYESVIGILEAELTAVVDMFRGLAPDQWRRPTLLVPVDPDLPKWTVFELAGHFDIAIGLTRVLIAGQEDAQPARDRTSFFINPRSETGPVVYAYRCCTGMMPPVQSVGGGQFGMFWSVLVACLLHRAASRRRAHLWRGSR